MHEMAELVQEHHHVAVLHQARVTGRAAREVAHQYTLGQLSAVDTVGERLGGEPLVLACARMHVQVDAAEPHLAVEDVVGGDRRMPGAHCGHRFDVDMKQRRGGDRKSTRLNSSHSQISYAVFCLKKKKNQI